MVVDSTQPRASRILHVISASSSPFHLHFLFSPLLFFHGTARNYARNKTKGLVANRVPVKGNPFYYMQSRTLTQGCHVLFCEETIKLRARVVVLIRSRGKVSLYIF